VKTLKLTEITGSLSTLAREGLREPVVVTRRGKPVMAVVPLTKNDDWESVSLSTHSGFLDIVERSAKAHQPGKGVSLREMRRRLGLRKRHAR
jgi:antitoxin (DNA-binding transcriptional repressor) of toxin-antitoxin stability system